MIRGRRTTRPGRLLDGGEQESLLARARREPALFGDFYAEYYEQVLGYFARRTFDPETAFDLMAETFVAAFASLQSFRGNGQEAERAWMWAIARNQLYRWVERGVVERRWRASLGVELPPISPSEFERIEELAGLDRIRGEVLGALDALAPDQRDAVRMRVVDELTYAEIATALGVSEQVVRARVSRGLRELARMLESRRDDLREATG